MAIRITPFDYKKQKAANNLNRFTTKSYFEKVIGKVFVIGSKASS